jgi:tetratricopeptide (TPR) repeat protein
MGLKLAPLLAAAAPLPEPAVDRIGRYTLLEKLGEGGCGTVYLAEQAEPVRRQVALKVIKLGMDTRQVIARFEAERQTLALMDHPLVAKVFDAGATDSGRPYFVMELVRGARITDYCDAHQLSTRERLRLFIQVCQAIQHAHQKGIIHRDLKPSNILVSNHDGVAAPRVIDFGIAKATEQRLSEQTLTESHLFLGTPAYMSPEQASGLDIDTRSDVYSLGVLLYELLTGRLPFDREELHRASFEEICRRIREQEPPRPSTRVSALAAADRTLLALRRQMEPAKLIGQICGDLDWIVMKALEKDRERRYEGAVALAEDVQRHLDHQPVVACPPTKLYQFQKFARRHRAAFAAASGIAAVLVAGGIVSTWQAVRATRAEREQRLLTQKADSAHAKELRAREKSDQVAYFLEEMLKGVGPAVARGRDTKLLREILDRTAERLGKELKGQPEVEADLRATIGEVYRQLALLEPAEAMQREALRLRLALFGPEHADVAQSLNQLANVLQAREKTSEAVALYRDSLALHRRLFGNEHHKVVAALNNLGNALSVHDAPAAEETLREALTLSRKIREETDAGSPNVLYSLGLVLKERGKLDEAEEMLREALALRRELHKGVHTEIAITLNALGNLYRDRGRLPEAETNLLEALEMQRKLHGDDPHPAVATSLGNLGLLLNRLGQQEQAEAMCRESLDIYRKLHGEENLKVATSLNNLALIQNSRRDYVAAEATFHEALSLRKKLLGAEHPTHVVLLNNLGATQRYLRKWQDAETSFRLAIEMGKKFPGDMDRDVVQAMQALASVRRTQGDLPAADTALREALALVRKAYGEDHPAEANLLMDLADVLADRGDLVQCATVLTQSLAIHRKRLPANSSRLESRIYDLAEILYRGGRFAEAEPLYREALAKRRDRLPPEDDLVVGTSASLARLLGDWALAGRAPASQERRSSPEITARVMEAERLLRECLEIRTRTLAPSSSRIADTKSRLGVAVVALAVADSDLDVASREAKFVESELLLVESYAALQKNDTADPRLRRDALERLVRLYEAWEAAAPGQGKAAHAEQWRQALAAVRQTAKPPKPNGVVTDGQPGKE